jgi:CDP-6-deoxy-D-xylo-4-hexulose-3-dehydrase
MKEKRKELINGFLEKLTEEFGQLPKFAHSVNNEENVYYSGPSFDNEEMSAAIEALLFSKWGATGENVYKFEREFSKFVKAKSSLMLNSGSSANLVLITALKKYLKWEDGDEIILSVVGFPTTLSPIMVNNLKPVFIDIEMDSLNFDITKIEEKITSRTKAIFISPVLGNSPDMDYLLMLKEKYNIELILDGCDSLGSKWDAKELTEYVIASTCSFYASHHLCTIEGGMISSNDSELVKLARSIAWWGRDCWCVGSSNLLSNGSCGNRFSNHWLEGHDDIVIDHKYVFSNIGYNLKPIDMQGAMGLVQLTKFPEFERLRRKHKVEIENILVKYIKGYKKIAICEKSDPSWFGVPIIVNNNDDKQKLVNYLERNNIQTRNYFAGNILLHPAYKHLDDWKLYPNANEVLKRVFFIGCSPNYTETTINYIDKVLSKYEE